MISRQTKFAFTLVELLVVIAIIGLLVAMLLPAVQSVRESSRRVQCSNRIRQIGISVAHYESSKQALPTGAAYNGDPHIRRGSVLTQMLPYLDYANLFNAIDFEPNHIDNQTYSDGTLIGATVIPVFICPSDSSPSLTSDGHAKFNYSASNGPTRLVQRSFDCNGAQWNDLAVGSSMDFDFAGPFSRQWDSLVKLPDITDGVSNTIFFGEVLPQCSEHVRRGWLSAHNGNGSTNTLIPLNFDSCDPDSAAPCNRPNTWNTELGFKSQHPSGVVMMFGDVSIHFVTEDIDRRLLQHLGAKADGQVTSFPP